MALSAGVRGTYRRHEPEHTLLHALVREHLETFLETGRSGDDAGYPPFIEREFRRYLDCGLLCHGFARVRCPSCGDEALVAFSCKGRICPSCQARRMSETAAYLVDQRLPAAPYRHWVLTVPWVLRYRLSVDRRLLSGVLGTFLRTVFAFQRHRGRTRGLGGGETGSVTFIQRFGGALNLHPHVHCLIPDGVFVPGPGGRLTFGELPVPGAEEIERLTQRIARRVTRLIERRLVDEAEVGGPLDETAAAMQAALTRSLSVPSPADPLRLDPGLDPSAERRGLCAKVAGFSLHAGQAVATEDREGLERLCRYGLRAPFSGERLSMREDGQVVYALARPWPNEAGAHELVLEPLEVLGRLAALCPSPGTHLIRYHGVFANRSKHRSRLPAPPEGKGSGVRGFAELDRGHGATPASSPDAGASPGRRGRWSWAQLLARVFFVDVLWCPRCGGRRQVISFLRDPTGVRRILTHLGLPTEAPLLAPVALSRVAGLFVESGDGSDGGGAPDADRGWAAHRWSDDARAPP